MKFKEFMTQAEVTVGVFVLLVSTTIGGFFYLDERFASASELKKLELRVDVNELKDTYRVALENLYFYRDQCRKYPDDTDLKQKLKEAEDQVKDLKDLIKKYTTTTAPT